MTGSYIDFHPSSSTRAFSICHRLEVEYTLDWLPVCCRTLAGYLSNQILERPLAATCQPLSDAGRVNSFICGRGFISAALCRLEDMVHYVLDSTLLP